MKRSCSVCRVGWTGLPASGGLEAAELVDVPPVAQQVLLELQLLLDLGGRLPGEGDVLSHLEGAVQPEAGGDDEGRRRALGASGHRRSGGQPAEHEQSGEGQQDRPRERRERDGATRYTSAVGGEGLRHGLSLPQRPFRPGSPARLATRTNPRPARSAPSAGPAGCTTPAGHRSAVRLRLVTQQQWGGGPRGGQSPYGTQPPPGWGAQGFGQPTYGAYGGPPGQATALAEPARRLRRTAARGAALRSPGPAAAQAQPADVVAARSGGAESAGDRRSGAGERRHRIVGLRVPERQLPGAAAGQRSAADPRAEDLRRGRGLAGQQPALRPDRTDPGALRQPADQRGQRLRRRSGVALQRSGRVPDAGLEPAGDGGPVAARRDPRSPSTGRRSPPSAASPA